MKREPSRPSRHRWPRALAAGGGSLLLGALLLAALLAKSSADVGAVLRAARSTPVSGFAIIVGLALLNTALAAERWHAIAAVSGMSMSRLSSLGFSAIGTGFGQVLPPHLATAGSRAIGIRLHGGSFLTGAATSLVEQAFDLPVLGILLLVSAVTYLIGGGAVFWFASAGAALALAWWSTSGLVRSVESYLARKTRRRVWGQRFAGLASAARMFSARPGLARYLLALSLARWGVLLLLSIATTSALRLPIAPWQLAASMPFPMVAVAIVATPAGLGANEWAMSTALCAFGVPLDLAVAWVLGSRLLSIAASLVVTGVGALLVLVEKCAPGGLRAEAAEPIYTLTPTPRGQS